MAKNNKFEGVAAGIFSQSPETIIPDLNEVPKAPIKKIKPAQTQQGRPRAKDIEENEELIKTSVYLTAETKIALEVFAAKKRMDRSEAIRYLIRNYIEE